MCSWGGQLVQFPGIERVKPARIRPARTLSPMMMLRSRVVAAPPAVNFERGILLDVGVAHDLQRVVAPHVGGALDQVDLARGA